MPTESLPAHTAEWRALDALSRRPLPDVAGLFASEPDRLDRLSVEAHGLLFDFSKVPVDAPALDALLGLARRVDLPGRLAGLAGGAIVNPSEGRAATHMACRNPAKRDLGPLGAVAARLRARALGGVRHLIHIGIGGSALGPQLLVDALGRDGDGPDVHVVSNIDGEALWRAIGGCDPAETRILAVSKSFTTQETLANLDSAVAWLEAAGRPDPLAQVIAVTAAPDRAHARGIAEVLSFPESVGGRYSLWSAVGLPLAARAGMPAFTALLDGAAAMDAHALAAPPKRNAPMLAALLDLWQAVFLGHATRAVFAYDERLRLLPAWLQQLEMESNGKSAAADGTPIAHATAPVTWGGTGTDAQHAVFQLLHQGMGRHAIEFVAAVRPGHGLDASHHRLLLANCLAQGSALLAGRPWDQTLAQAGGDAALARQKAFPGNRGSSTILLPAVDPASLGALLAFYEARTFAFGCLLGVNSFDQWGVELGKEVARTIAGGEGGAGGPALDPSTARLMARAGLRREAPRP